MASGGLRFHCTPPRLGESSPSPLISPSHHRKDPLNLDGLMAPSGSKGCSENSNPLDIMSPPKGGPVKFQRLREKSIYLTMKRNNDRANLDYNFGPKHKKRRNTGSREMCPPHRFLLGGNASDPLNLNSMNGVDLTITPKSSPIPTPKYKKEVEILIPTNPKDPLNLSDLFDSKSTPLCSPFKPKARNRKRKRTDSEGPHEPNEKESENLVSSSALEPEGDRAKKILFQVPAQPIESSTSSSNSTSQQIKDPATSSSSSIKKIDQEVDPSDPLLSDQEPILLPHESVHFPAHHQPQGHNVRHHHHHHSNHHQHNRKRHRPHQPKRKKEQHVEQPKTYRTKNQQFKYGNYDRYYGYRNLGQVPDVRIPAINREWIEGKEVLDIGCNTGQFTLSIAKNLAPKLLIGIDIDGKLINIARKNVRHYVDSKGPDLKFPISLSSCRGPVVPSAATASVPMKTPSPFPNNVLFSEANYILESDDLLQCVDPEYDTILCMSLTKWVHLNWGDDGLKRMFKRIYRNLRPGGQLILEPQQWPSYTKKNSFTEDMDENFKLIRLRPEKFPEYLMSEEIGFTSCDTIDTPLHTSKGFRRPIYLLKKGPE